MNDELRQQVKCLKCFQNISYIEIAKKLNIKPHSFYNWLSVKNYEFSYETQLKLKQIITQLKEETK